MAAHDGDRTKTMCPYLGTLDEEGSSAPCVDYPSFENMCFVGSRADAIMLTDQATFCLSSGYRHCPRLTNELDATTARSSSNDSNGESAGAFASGADRSDPLMHAIADIEEALAARRKARAKRKRRIGWISAATLFLGSLLCGGFFAAYLGWQLVNRDSPVTAVGSVTTLAAVATPALPPVYLIVTATQDPPSSQQPAQATSAPNAAMYPKAVTPTAAPSDGNDTSSRPQDDDQSLPTSPNLAQSELAVATPPAVNMLVAIPTRRPTPILDLAINVPTVPQATPIPSPTPPPPLGTPVVVFAAEDEELESGDCTTVSWHVENVRAVYYENLGVDGHGEQEECIRDKNGDYTLTVVLPDGGTKYYTVTVGMILPTATPTPTATRPPIVEPTATWTPVIPTDTPTPDMQWGVRLAIVDGSEQKCPSGERCDLELRVTNTSLGIDDISVVFLQSGPWDAALCRLDGVCSDSKLTLASVGPSNTALVLLSVELPDGAEGTSESYTVRAISEGSNGKAGSEAASINIVAQ